MKKLSIILICCALVLSGTDLFAQSRNTNTASKRTTSSKNRKKTNFKPKPADVALPYNSNDCLFPVDIEPDVTFGPTVAPNGAGKVLEIKATKKAPELFEYEHNTVWYRFTVPYNGNLELTITPNDPKDDYDFLLYKYTDVYFSNHIIQNTVRPLVGVVNAIDTASKTGAIGMSVKAKDRFVSKRQTTSFVKSVPVYKGEVYYIVVDNMSSKGSGHSIKASIQVNSYHPIFVFFDPKARKAVEVDLTILEKNTDNRAIVKNPRFRKESVKLVPKFEYTMYAKKPGYFSIFKDFQSDIYKGDSIVRFLMRKIEKGTKYPINEVYFDQGETELLPESDSVLLNYVAMFKNHPDVKFAIKGFVTTYGFDVSADIQQSLERAVSVKNFFIKNGISEDRMTVSGMTQSEVKRTAAAMLSPEGASSKKIELIITDPGYIPKPTR